MNALTPGARLRSRAPVTATAGAATSPGGGSWAHSGAEARARQQQELQKQKEAAERRAAGIYMPFRFWLGYPKSAELIVLDNEPAFFIYEHQLKNSVTGKFEIYESCPKDFEPCPICSGEAKVEGSGKDSYYVLMLSVIDLTPYLRTDKKTGVQTEIPHTRKLLPVKVSDQGFFLRQHERKGTLRGMHLLMSRDTKDQSSIGRPELVMGDAENPDFVGFHADAELMEAFASAPILDQQGKVTRQANIDCFPFPYDKLFPKPSGTLLRQRYHANALPGSAAANANEWGDTGTQAGAPAAGVSNRPAPAGADLDDEIPF